MLLAGLFTRGDRTRGKCIFGLVWNPSLFVMRDPYRSHATCAFLGPLLKPINCGVDLPLCSPPLCPQSLPLANPGWLPSSDTSMLSINIYRMPSFGPLLPSTLCSPSTCTLYSGEIYSATLFPVLPVLHSFSARCLCIASSSASAFTRVPPSPSLPPSHPLPFLPDLSFRSPASTFARAYHSVFFQSSPASWLTGILAFLSHLSIHIPR